jgi:phospholipase/lecithinase/hemolysin
MVLVLVGAEPAAACYQRLFSFGDSLADTGNFRFYYGNSSGEPALRLPYGETFFRRPTGRFSNGRLVIDFIGTPATPIDSWFDQISLRISSSGLI